MSEVSLCIVRFEACFYPVKNIVTAEESGVPITKGILLRGFREVNEIKIESYIPLKRVLGTVSSNMDDLIESASNNPSPQRDELIACSSSSTCDTITFVSGNPYVEIINGIIHLFKQNELTNVKEAAGRTKTVCILAIPAIMTCGDLVSFIASFHSDLKYIKIVKSSTPNQYLALLTFRSPEAVEQFYVSFNGVPFNTLDPERCCNVVFVSKVEIIHEEDGGGQVPDFHTELPTCPVCLERMDESVDGILTIVCNHSFHSDCLAKWSDSSCPVCRYVLTVEQPNSFCSECQTTQSLWICLICGHIGCGRYLQGHAYQHYVDTNHCFSLKIGTDQVWDYIGDNFVHRLLQNQPDGKLVELPHPALSEKKERLTIDFARLLSSQLDAQRQFYEEKINLNQLRLKQDLAVLEGMNKSLKEENSKFNERVNDLCEEKVSLEKKVNNVSSKLSVVQKELLDEQNLSKALKDNACLWKKQCDTIAKELEDCQKCKKNEIKELQEQIRDLMFFIEGSKTLKERSDVEEIVDGKIEVALSSPSTSGTSRKKKNKNKKK